VPEGKHEKDFKVGAKNRRATDRRMKQNRGHRER
jgi:hypothetical protein